MPSDHPAGCSPPVVLQHRDSPRSERAGSADRPLALSQPAAPAAPGRAEAMVSGPPVGWGAAGGPPSGPRRTSSRSAGAGRPPTRAPGAGRRLSFTLASTGHGAHTGPNRGQGHWKTPNSPTGPPRRCGRRSWSTPQGPCALARSARAHWVHPARQRLRSLVALNRYHAPGSVRPMAGLRRLRLAVGCAHRPPRNPNLAQRLLRICVVTPANNPSGPRRATHSPPPP